MDKVEHAFFQTESTTEDMLATIEGASEDPVGGLAYLLPGTFEVNARIVVKSRTYIVGAGIGTTILRVVDPLPGHENFGFFDVGFPTGPVHSVMIANLTVDCNNQMDFGSRLRMVTDLTYRNLEFKNTRKYGIASVEYLEDAEFSNILLKWVGTDGIDFKNQNPRPSRAVRLRDIVVDGFGLGAGELEKAAIDIRGPGITIDGLHITGVGNSGNHRSLRVRDPGAAWGRGGAGLRANNIVIYAGSGQPAAIEIRDRNCALSNVYVQGGQRAIRTQGTQQAGSATGLSVMNAHFVDCANGAVIEGEADNVSLANIHAQGIPAESWGVAIHTASCTLTGSTPQRTLIAPTATDTKLAAVQGHIHNIGSNTTIS